jgi:hypothetical protein
MVTEFNESAVLLAMQMSTIVPAGTVHWDVEIGLRRKLGHAPALSVVPPGCGWIFDLHYLGLFQRHTGGIYQNETASS